MVKNITKVITISIFAFILGACSVSRDPIDVAEFYEMLTERGFVVLDLTYQADEHYIDFDIVLLLMASAENQRIQLTQYKNYSAAQRTFYYFRNQADEILRNGNYVRRTAEGTNFSTFSINASGVYISMLRIDNITLIAEVPSRYRDEIREIIGNFN